MRSNSGYRFLRVADKRRFIDRRLQSQEPRFHCDRCGTVVQGRDAQGHATRCVANDRSEP
jgi:hypothetical protein